MAYEHRNVIVGAADVYMSREDSTTWTNVPAFPDRVPGESFRTTMERDHSGDTDEWRHMGYTQGGLEITYAPDYTGIEVDQSLDDILLTKTRQTVTITTTLAEATLRNLLAAWGQGGGTFHEGLEPNPDFDPELAETNDDGDYTTPGANDRFVAVADSITVDISAGDLGDEPTERALIFIGKAPRVDGTGANSRRERVWYLDRALAVESTSVGHSRGEASTIPVSLRALPSGNGLYGRVIERAVA